MRHSIETTLATILVPGVAVTFIPYVILSRSNTGWPARFGILQGISTIGMLAGLSMVLWVSYAFVTMGKGTPIPIDPPTHFVTSGFFRYVRNPMYVGALLVLISEAIFFASGRLVIYALFLWLALHIFLIVFEEPQLAKRFGESFQAYMTSTPRWIPRIPPKNQ